MRLYLIVNRYSMGVQAGIQGLHVIPELYEKYNGMFPTSEATKLSTWAQDHKTVMLLRSFGGHDSIAELQEKIAPLARNLALPFAVFHESAMRNCATAFGIVVPTEYYETPFDDLGDGDLMQIRDIIGQFPFAV